MATPQISVLMSVRNGAAFLPATLDSLSAQSFDAVEFVTVDDGSDDATSNLLADWAAGWSRADRNADVAGVERVGPCAEHQVRPVPRTADCARGWR